jgi:hypothetical protein
VAGYIAAKLVVFNGKNRLRKVNKTGLHSLLTNLFTLHRFPNLFILTLQVLHLYLYSYSDGPSGHVAGLTTSQGANVRKGVGWDGWSRRESEGAGGCKCYVRMRGTGCKGLGCEY